VKQQNIERDNMMHHISPYTGHRFVIGEQVDGKTWYAIERGDTTQVGIQLSDDTWSHIVEDCDFDTYISMCEDYKTLLAPD
jgi:hypothetical protein